MAAHRRAHPPPPPATIIPHWSWAISSSGDPQHFDSLEGHYIFLQNSLSIFLPFPINFQLLSKHCSVKQQANFVSHERQVSSDHCRGSPMDIPCFGDYNKAPGSSARLTSRLHPSHCSGSMALGCWVWLWSENRRCHISGYQHWPLEHWPHCRGRVHCCHCHCVS